MWQKIVTIIVSAFVDKLFSSLASFFSSLWKKAKIKKEGKVDEKNSGKYQEVINNPNKTEQELDQATSDYLNGVKRD